MEPLGPWPGSGARCPIAIAVSGGADSTALAALSQRWATARGLPLLALVVDHRLRPGSTAEATRTLDGLRSRGTEARLLTVRSLDPGPALARRARDARYRLLTEACRNAGAIDLLLGHHAGDQAETVLMRARAGSGPDGLAGMAGLTETDDLRLLRPLLPVPPARLRATLLRHRIDWIEDPSNRDQAAQRVRLRQELSRPDDRAAHLLRDAAAAGASRMRRRKGEACALAAGAVLRPEGFALLPSALLPADALAALVRSVGGNSYPPSRPAVDRLLRCPGPATLAGTRLVPAGRLGPGWLLLREADAVGAPADAADGARWDGRFVLDTAGACVPPDVRIEALGADRALFRRRTTLPASVLSTLPVLRRQGILLAVPHLGWALGPGWAGPRFAYRPAAPASDGALFTLRQGLARHHAEAGLSAVRGRPNL